MKSSQLMLFGEINGICCKNYTKTISTQYAKNGKFLRFTAFSISLLLEFKRLIR